MPFSPPVVTKLTVKVAARFNLHPKLDLRQGHLSRLGLGPITNIAQTSISLAVGLTFINHGTPSIKNLELFSHGLNIWPLVHRILKYTTEAFKSGNNLLAIGDIQLIRLLHEKPPNLI